MYDLKKCPFCSEDINIELTKCPNCNQWLPQDNKTPQQQRLIEQNYPMGRFLAIALFVITLFTNRAFLGFLDLAYDEAIIVSQIINLGIKVWLLFLFMQYLLNFKLHGIRVVLIWIIIANAVMTIISSSTVFYYKSIGIGFTSSIMVIQSLVNAIAFLVYIIGLVMAGFNLCKFKGDWVGGLKTVGIIFLVIAIFTSFSTIANVGFRFVFAWDVDTQLLVGGLVNAGVNILLAYGMYNVFSNAEKCQNRMES